MIIPFYGKSYGNGGLCIYTTRVVPIPCNFSSLLAMIIPLWRFPKMAYNIIQLADSLPGPGGAPELLSSGPWARARAGERLTMEFSKRMILGKLWNYVVHWMHFIVVPVVFLLNWLLFSFWMMYNDVELQEFGSSWWGCDGNMTYVMQHTLTSSIIIHNPWGIFQVDLTSLWMFVCHWKNRCPKAAPEPRRERRRAASTGRPSQKPWNPQITEVENLSGWRVFTRIDQY